MRTQLCCLGDGSATLVCAQHQVAVPAAQRGAPGRACAELLQVKCGCGLLPTWAARPATHDAQGMCPASKPLPPLWFPVCRSEAAWPWMIELQALVPGLEGQTNYPEKPQDVMARGVSAMPDCFPGTACVDSMGEGSTGFHSMEEGSAGFYSMEEGSTGKLRGRLQACGMGAAPLPGGCCGAGSCQLLHQHVGG